MGKKAPKTDTRTKILDATIKILTEKDISEVTTRLIAREAGVSKGTLFHHFNTKESLLYFATEKIYLDLLDRIMKISSKTKDEEVIRTITENVLSFFAETPGMMRLLLNSLSAIETQTTAEKQAMISRDSMYESFLQPLYTEASKIFERLGYEKPLLMARLYIGIVDGIGFQIDAERIKKGDPLIDEFVNGVVTLFQTKQSRVATT